jgi:CRP/FNR family transcriptional regulator, anaerobic regulatory protein
MFERVLAMQASASRRPGQRPNHGEHPMNIPQVQETSSYFSGNSRSGLASIDRRDWTNLHDMLDLIGVAVGNDLHASIVQPTVRRLQAGELLFLEGAPTTSIHVVRTGVFKVFRTAEDGYEQVFGFVRRGELLGCDALSDTRHQMATVALEDASVFAIALPDFFALTQDLPSFDRGVMRAVAKAMIDLTRVSEMMAAAAAEVRLARFLLHVSRCMSTCGQSARSLRLQMTRRDIGSYLGVAHETISRSFAALMEAGLIEVEQRRVEILDIDALQRYAQGTRAPSKGHFRGSPFAAHSEEKMALRS